MKSSSGSRWSLYHFTLYTRTYCFSCNEDQDENVDAFGACRNVRYIQESPTIRHIISNEIAIMLNKGQDECFDTVGSYWNVNSI